MIETLIALMIIGFVVGFVFSMPVAGPISILVVSNTLHDHRKRALYIALGGAIADFIYIFILVFGFTKLLTRHEWIISYILLIGAVFIFIQAIKLLRYHIKLTNGNGEDEVVKTKLIKNIRHHHGLFTGFFVNFLNPTIIFGWMISSFVILSFVAANGINVGGMEYVFLNNVEEIRDQAVFKAGEPEDLVEKMEQTKHPPEPNTFMQIINSLDYALSVAFGTVIWFYLLTGFLKRHKEKIPTQFFNYLVHGLAIFLFLISGYLLYDSLKLFHLI
ncbi:MAG: LysE family transporter [Caldisericaceae bacterium]|nr:LysE family transporter [Caldisericaceae bacterium]